MKIMEEWTQEDEREFAMLCKERKKREEFISEMDGKNIVSNYSMEKVNREMEKYGKYAEQLVRIEKRIQKLSERMPS